MKKPFTILICILLFVGCGMSEKKYVSLQKEVYNTLVNVDSIYYSLNKGYSFNDYGDYTFDKNAESGKQYNRDFGVTNYREKLIENGLNNKAFKELFTNNWYEQMVSNSNARICNVKDLGATLVGDISGNNVIFILSYREGLNYGAILLERCKDIDKYENKFIYKNNDLSRFMSDEEYINYHLNRIHILDEQTAVYKNFPLELSIEGYGDILYFTLIKEEGKWLIDDIAAIHPSKENFWDLATIGEERPLYYYDVAEYDTIKYPVPKRLRSVFKEQTNLQ